MRGGVEQKKEQKKEGLLEAAYQLFLEKGVNKTSVDEIVKKANVAKGTFYLYFHDKDQLLGQLVYNISAQVLEMGDKKYLAPIPELKRMSLDNGRLFKEEALRELPFKQAKYRVITKGHLNLQNRKDLLTIEDVTPNEWMTIGLDLQPTIYKLNKGDKLRLVLYTTDFEHTIRDNSDYELTVDLSQSQMTLPN